MGPCNNATNHHGSWLSVFLLIILLATSIHDNPHRQYSAMGIRMRATISKEKPTKTTITPKQVQQSLCNSKSPHLDNVNSLLVEINLPASCFNNALEALCPSTNRGSNNNDPSTTCAIWWPPLIKMTMLDSRSQSLTVHGVRGIRRRVRA
jgi:hypothetical protein